MNYRFWGWEHADAKAITEEYKGIKTPIDLYDALSHIWCADTCAPRMRDSWTKENMTLGQCSITAFLAQDIFGGKVYGILRAGGNYHCYNVIGDCRFDLTSEQFRDEVLDYEDNPEQFREIHFEKEEKRLRYEYLKTELKKYCEENNKPMIYTYHYQSPLGGITLSGTETALTGLWFNGQKYFGSTLPKEYEEKSVPVFAETAHWLDIYFSGKEPDFTPPLLMETTEFGKMVWKIMLTIPYGKTMTYGEIAERIANQKGLPRMSAQAVGGAVGHNAISLIIPCHRVVGKNGSLTGYAGGIDKKVKLLTMEQADMSKLFVPKKGTAISI